MLFPESWLREFCDPQLTSAQLADTLTMGGLEVEEVQPVAPAFARVVVADILSAVPHPDADRLRVCKVDVGQPEPLAIVCGAPNARAGIKVPCALVGACLPASDGGQAVTIKAAKLRGVQSQGMLCSARELGLSQDHEGLLELSADLEVGRDVRDALALDEMIFNVKLTPDMGHALSVYGVARELAALTGAPLLQPEFRSVEPVIADRLPVVIEASDLCGRFSGRIVRGVNPQARTPAWMVQRLERSGQRSVSALVDISNYVMLELGRPTHIFDLSKIAGGLSVRWGQAGEQLKLLNGNTVTVDATVGVITDDRALESLAGIMGGAATAVSDDTTDIYIEAAFWWPDAVRGRSRRFNFSTEAGQRFERGVDPSSTIPHIERITGLVLEICGTAQTRCGPIDDQAPNLPVVAPVRLRSARAEKILGMPVPAERCREVLQRLAFPFEEENGVFTVVPPPYRFDIRIEEDLIEEVARVVGYEQVPQDAPVQAVLPCVRSESLRGPFAIRRAMAALGYLETINFSFVDETWERQLAGNTDPVRLVNPIAAQLSVMRSSLLGSLLQVLRHNADRRVDRLRVFEIGRVFMRDAAVQTSTASVRGVHQPMHLAGAILGPAAEQGWEGRQAAADFYDAKGDVEALLVSGSARFQAAAHPAFHPGRCASIALDGRIVGHVGELHPRWRQRWELPAAPVLFELELEAVLRHPLPAVEPVPLQLPVQRDIAVVVSELVSHDDLLGSVRGSEAASTVARVSVFDIYRSAAGSHGGEVGPGEKSVALRLHLLSADGASLTDERIEAVMSTIVEALRRDCGARLRA